MEDLTIIDGAVIAIVLISGILAFARGFMRELTSIAGWVGAAVVAYFLAPRAESLMYEIPLLNGLIDQSCNLAMMAAFAIVFVIALIVLSLFAPLLASVVRGRAIGTVDKGLGFLFGLARGVLLVVVALFVYEEFFAVGDGIEIVTTSKTYELLGETPQSFATEVESAGLITWFSARFDEMTANCTDRAGEAPAALPASEAAPAETAAPAAN
ncbi:CvpA family protein [Abyssibius alkaniclasticus]|uniref:CvpA family protein n=1 Tax=Abyssibius alkaniclasticus TaxID=2881234 RepID=UPI004059E5F8|tara:strand:+ start:154 stop:789 length:636 start_codon:yes stop_codon:yes gene_type:complete